MNTTTKDHITLDISHSKESDDLAGALGISTERKEELCETVKTVFEDRKSYDDMTGQMKAIAEKTENHEELAFTMFIYGVWTEQHHNFDNPLQALQALLGRN